jgi:large conductance mechanosensitive channel
MTTPAAAPKDQSLLAQFRAFLLETNALALAIGVVIGGAVGKLVSALVGGIIMPLIGVVLPGGEWRTIKITLDSKGNAILLGDVLGAALDFLIIAAIVFFIAKKLLRIEAKK